MVFLLLPRHLLPSVLPSITVVNRLPYLAVCASHCLFLLSMVPIKENCSLIGTIESIKNQHHHHIEPTPHRKYKEPTPRMVPTVTPQRILSVQNHISHASNLLVSSFFNVHDFALYNKMLHTVVFKIFFPRSRLIPVVSSSFLLLKAAFAIAILTLISLEYRPSSPTILPSYLKSVTCFSCIPFIGVFNSFLSLSFFLIFVFFIFILLSYLSTVSFSSVIMCCM